MPDSVLLLVVFISASTTGCGGKPALPAVSRPPEPLSSQDLLTQGLLPVPCSDTRAACKQDA